MARRRGLQVCYGRCYEDLTLPYLPFVEILRPHLEQLPEDMQQVLGADAEVLSQLLYRAGRPLSTVELTDVGPDRARQATTVSRGLSYYHQVSPKPSYALRDGRSTLG